jgi:predicted Zn-dependent protease
MLKIRTQFLARLSLPLLVGGLLLSGCSLFGSKAARAYNEYQTAMAMGDLNRAHIALVKLVKADEDEPQYWVELGKIELRLGIYDQAYQALARAHELDRNNVEVIATLAQMALASGHIDLAEEQAKSLALLAPDSPAVILVHGYVALEHGNLVDADAAAEKLLASTPNEPNATILRARVLIAGHRVDEAIALLENQLEQMPDDPSAVRALVTLYKSKSDWRGLARVEAILYKLVPGNEKVAVDWLEALIRSGDTKTAANLSRQMLASGNARIADRVFDAWATYAAGSILPDAARLAAASSGDERVSYADYFNRMGKPAAARDILGNAVLPVTHGNARRNAVVAESLARLGQANAAMRLFNEVLETEPDQVEALRGRSALQAKAGLYRQSIADAQRLVSGEPESARDRLILADAFASAGRKDDLRRTLWDAFQDMPDDDRVFSALNRVLVAQGDLDAARRLAEERSDRSMQNLSQNLA